MSTDSRFPHGYSPEQYVAELIAEHGSAHALAAALADHSGRSPETERKGIMRLRNGSSGGGAVLGRLVRNFGLPQHVKGWLKWMGQYHSRFADMPTDMCDTYVTLWDRSPITDRRDTRVWLSLSKSVVALRLRRLDDAKRFLSATRRDLKGAADVSANLEHHLSRAYLASVDADYRGELAWLDAAEAELTNTALSDSDRHCYHARWVDQLAFRRNRMEPSPRTFAETLALYEQIPSDSLLPFVDFRRAHGRAYCLRMLGRRNEARDAAAAACTHAGDGGYVRLRSMAIKAQAHLCDSEPALGEKLRARSFALAALLRDEELLHRARRADPAK